MPHNIFLTVRRVDLSSIFIKQKTNDMKENLTIDDMIIEAHPGGQNCRSCPLVYMENFCNVRKVEGLDKNTCFTHTITLKPTTYEHI